MNTKVTGDGRQGVCHDCYEKLKKPDQKDPETETLEGECANCGKRDVGLIPWLTTIGPSTLL